MKDKVVRCVYNFPAETDSDLDLRIGDVIRVTRVLNPDWYEGQVHNRRGQFPAAYVEDCKDLFDLAVADRAFSGDQEGDLSFQSGDYIVVTEMVDENWMRGYVQGGGYGLFPRSFVKEITLDPSEVSSVIGEIRNESKPNDSVSFANKSANEDSVITEDEAVCSVEHRQSWVDVLENFSAMDSTELNLIAGTKVKIVCDVDDFWCKGISLSGEEGIFPRNFVDLPVLEGNNTDDIHDSNPVDQQAIPEGKGDAPVLEISMDSKKENSEINSIGRVVALFNFAGPEQGDLSFSQGTEIELLEIINNEWMKGRTNDDIGIFPSNYVRVVEMLTVESVDTARKTEATISVEMQSLGKAVVAPSESILQTSPHSVSPPTVVEPKKPPPPKPSKPQRPKLPDSKKQSDEISSFSSDLKLKGNPLIIIPVKYRKQGSSNIVILRNWRKEELEELKHSRES